MMAKLRNYTLKALRMRNPNPLTVASSPIPSMVMFIGDELFLPFTCNPSELEEIWSRSLFATFPMKRNEIGVESSPFSYASKFELVKIRIISVFF